MGRLLRFIRRVRETEKLSLHRIIPILAVIILSVVVAGIFYVMERNKQGHQFSFWKAFYFIQTVQTTIGYGDVVAKTGWGQVLTILYALVFIPLTLLVLKNVGEMFAAVANAVWIEFCCCCQCCVKSKQKRQFQHQHLKSSDSKSSAVPVVVIQEAEDTEITLHKNNNLPVWIGLVATVGWLVGCAAFFAYSADWSFGEAAYFTMVSVTTIGFGDYRLGHYELVLANFALLIIGLALFSMCIDLVQQSIDNAGNRMLLRIAQDYKKTLEEGEGKEQEHISIEDMMAKESIFVRMLLSDNRKEMLRQELDMRSSMRTKGTQTIPATEDKDVLAVEEMKEKKVGNHVVSKEKGTISREYHWWASKLKDHWETELRPRLKMEQMEGSRSQPDRSSRKDRSSKKDADWFTIISWSPPPEHRQREPVLARKRKTAKPKETAPESRATDSSASARFTAVRNPSKNSVGLDSDSNDEAWMDEELSIYAGTDNTNESGRIPTGESEGKESTEAATQDDIEATENESTDVIKDDTGET